MEELGVMSCLLVVGLLILLSGILARLGYFRLIYTAKGYPVIMPSTIAHVGIPVGLMATLMGMLPLFATLKARQDLFNYVIIPLCILSLVLATWQPWWLKPTWLRWLEKEHGDIIYLLWEDVRQDRWNWELNVRTQEQLEAWVAEVRRKHNLDRSK